MGPPRLVNRERLNLHGDGFKNAIVCSIRIKRVMLSTMALLFSGLIVVSWEGFPASEIIGIRHWGPALRLKSEAKLVDSKRGLKMAEEGWSRQQKEDNMFLDPRLGLVNESVSTELLIETYAPKEGAINATLQPRGCNLSQGHWVKDKTRPLYSGNSCSWLSPNWACKLSKTRDFSYEKYRWQPDDCDIPRFDGQKFLERMRNKSIAFVGDSVGRQQFQSLLCLITGANHLPAEDIGREFDFHDATKPEGWAYRFKATNTTILFYWSATLCKIQFYNATDPHAGSALHIDYPPLFLSTNVHKFNVIVLNTGHHWNPNKLRLNKWDIYVGGAKMSKQHLRIEEAYKQTVTNLAGWLNKEMRKREDLAVFMRSLSPRHFMNGDWNNGGYCDSKEPFKTIQNFTMDLVAGNAVSGTKLQLLNITYLSQFRVDAHVSKHGRRGTQDCLHWCLPGVPDVWNEVMYMHLLSQTH